MTWIFYTVVVLVLVFGGALAGYFYSKQRKQSGCPECKPTECKQTVCPECKQTVCPECKQQECPTLAATPSSDSDPSFYQCASEGGSCVVPIKTPIFYGAQGKYTKKDAVAASTPCTTDVFGGDPAPLQAKMCLVSKATLSS